VDVLVVDEGNAYAVLDLAQEGRESIPGHGRVSARRR